MRHAKPVRLKTAPTGGETRQTGAVENRTYRRGESVHLFFEFTIIGVTHFR